MKIVVLKPPGFRKLSHFSEMRNDALMHREGLKGFEDAGSAKTPRCDIGPALSRCPVQRGRDVHLNPTSCGR